MAGINLYAMRATRTCAAVLMTLAATLSLAAPAGATTTFGANPNQAVTPGLGCAFGAPFITPFGVFEVPGTGGSQSCMWTWNSPSGGSDVVPIPATGGSGTVTSVTLPAMPSPGTMRVVVLTAALAASSEPSKPDYICCQVKQVGPDFTVPANQVTTVAQSLHVSATETANLSVPGDTSFGDLLGIAVMSPSASLPILYTGNTDLSNFDGAFAYYPAPGGASGEYREPINEPGFQVLASFTLDLEGPAPAPGPGPAPGAAGGGLKLIGKPVVGADGRTVNLGTATNPPIAGTTQTLTELPAARASSPAARKKPAVYGSGKTKVAAGKTVALNLKLNGRGRARLSKQGKLKATLTVVSTTTSGTTQKTTRAVTVKPAKRGHGG